MATAAVISAVADFSLKIGGGGALTIFPHIPLMPNTVPSAASTMPDGKRAYPQFATDWSGKVEHLFEHSVRVFKRCATATPDGKHHQRLKPSGCREAKPTEGAAKRFLAEGHWHVYRLTGIVNRGENGFVCWLGGVITMQMIGGEFRRDSGLLPRLKDPSVESWYYALADARRRTRRALKGINPWDSIVVMMRDKHQSLIGEPTAERIYLDIGRSDPQQPRTMTVVGRSLVTGLPARIEISSLEVQAVDNDQASIPYLDWSSNKGEPTIGILLAGIAAHEAQWLFEGVLRLPVPAEFQELFPSADDDTPTFFQGKTLSQHWNRLERVRDHLFNVYREMTLENFQIRRHSRDLRFGCTAEWVLHELCQFEAECRTSIKILFAEAKEALNPETPAH